MGQNLEAKRYFVTGGAGFIGSHLVERLLELGSEVTVYDNLTAPGRGGWSAGTLPRRKGLTFIKADILDPETLTRCMQGHDFVWHMAANTDIPGGTQNTKIDLDNCVIGTYHVLEAMRQNAIERLVFTSTSAVYGEVEKLPFTEEVGPIFPISLYGAAKLACDAYISTYCHLFGLRAWSFRFGNVVGDRMGHGVIFDFIQKLRRNPQELEVLGDGEQDKNYFLVEDCIEGMICVVRNSTRQCDIFNLGCESTIKVKDIARIVIEEMGLNGTRIRFTGGVRGWPGDVPKVSFNMGKVKRLGWAPRYTSEEAVRIAARRILGKRD